MSHFLQDFNLPCNSFDVFFVFDPCFLEDFDSHRLLRQHMLGHLHLAKCAFTKVFAEHVVSKFGPRDVRINLRLFFLWLRDRVLYLTLIGLSLVMLDGITNMYGELLLFLGWQVDCQF